VAENESSLGKVGWTDLTVPDATSVRDFYSSVVGWTSQGLDMGGYEDFVMMPNGSEDGVAGICHARGVNADLPPVWLVYITVADVAEAMRKVEELGGTILRAPSEPGPGTFAVIRDPAGAVCALYQA